MSGIGRTLNVAAMVMAALSSWSCSSTAPEPTPRVAAIVVTPATSTLAVDAQLPLQAQVRDAEGALLPDAEVTWTVENSQVVRVSAAGVVRALSVGTSQVAANALGKSGIAIVTVNAPATQGPATPGNDPPATNPPATDPPGNDPPGNGSTPTVATVTVAAPSTTPEVGSTLQLTATAKDDKGNVVPNQTFAWSSSNTDKATVSASGVVTAVRQGGVTITATVSAGGASGSIDLEVKKK